MTDTLLRGILHQSGIRFVICEGLQVCQEALRRQKCPPLAMEALGRTMIASALLSASLKDKERLAIQISSTQSPIRAIFVDAAAQGRLRGYVSYSKLLAFTDIRPLTLAQAVGTRGVMNVIHDDGSGEFYRGLSQLTAGTIDQDLVSYLDTSAQIPSAIALSVNLSGAEVVSAGGILLQLLPGGDAERLRSLAQEVNTKALSELLSEGQLSAVRIFEKLLPLEEIPEVLGQSKVEFFCPCSQERAERALFAAGLEEIKALIQEQHGATITCEFCGNVYTFTEAHLVGILDKMRQVN